MLLQTSYVGGDEEKMNSLLDKYELHHLSKESNK